MANELKLTLYGTLTNGSFTDQIPSEEHSITQSAIGAWMPIVSVGTSEEDMAVVDIGTLGWMYIKNLDSSNYVQWGPKSGGAMVPVGRIKAGEFAILRLEPGITIRWVANTAAVKLQCKVYES